MKKEITIIFGSIKKVSEEQEKKECCVCEGDVWINERNLIEGLPLIENKIIEKAKIEGKKKYLCSDCGAKAGFMWTEYQKLSRDKFDKLFRKK